MPALSALLSPTAPPSLSRRKSSHGHHHHNHHAASSSTSRRLLQAAMIFCLGSMSLLPILVLETQYPSFWSASWKSMQKNHPTMVSVDRLFTNMAKHLQEGHLQPLLRTRDEVAAVKVNNPLEQALHEQQEANAAAAPERLPPAAQKESTMHHYAKKIPISLSQLSPDPADWTSRQPLARGVAGRPMDQTPALLGAKRASVQCSEINVDSLAYWNHPQGTRDAAFISPFSVQRENDATTQQQQYYLTFTPDPGGWNNIRMSMEIIFVLAAATGRTLVLPPREPLYLLHHDKEEKHRGFADFYPLDAPEFIKRVKVISMEQFLQIEGGADGLVPIPNEQRTAIMNAADHCDHRKASESYCGPIWEFLESGTLAHVHSPNISSEESCMVFDEATYAGERPTPDIQTYVDTVCGEKRQQVFMTKEFQQHRVLHFRAGGKTTRLLTHFYAMIHFTNPKIDHYYKRFVRDFLHYHDVIFCAAGKIVKALQAEAAERNFTPDENGAGGYSAMHIRRGDLQYKKVKIPAKEWYENTKEVWLPNEILYIATDEKQKEFFNDLAAHHDLRFLDDYWELAGLGDLDGNYMGMIDTIVASRGRAFAGTFFSTFTGFINRMRGYHGLSMHDTWYSFLPRKNVTHSWDIMDSPRYAFEWPDGFVGIDADEWPSRDVF
ncbi:hypothetical protein MPSEU_000266300 [Mayamaea pseudoterrestris]|nr:hypothetical protein MPSEU_000266300 [Mayamaea pseudoterrestris]